MSDKTGIEWTDATWNPVTGCTEVTPGCDHCYAKTFAERWRGTPGHYFENGFDVQLRPDKLDQPLRWKKPRKVFVNSMSDLFHDGVPGDYIIDVFVVMAMAKQHTFQLLTKRHGRMRSLLSDPGFRDEVQTRMEIIEHPQPVSLTWPLPNVWVGVSAEDQKRADLRIPALLNTPAAIRFVSAEPLLGPIDIVQAMNRDPRNAGGIDWVIAGGESGRNARAVHPDWIRGLRDDCKGTIAFLFKQWGEYEPECQLGISAGDGKFIRCACRGSQPSHIVGMKRVGKKVAGRTLDGRTWDEYPETVVAR